MDGPGFRNSVYLAGCNHHCEGCHNPESWDMKGGYEITSDDLVERLAGLGLDVTFSGGDPMLQAEELAGVVKRLKQRGLGVWVYTGFTYEYAERIPAMRSVLDGTDVLVDGEFVLSCRNTSLLFRGSSNQRLVDVKASRNAGRVVEWTRDSDEF